VLTSSTTRFVVAQASCLCGQAGSLSHFTHHHVHGGHNRARRWHESAERGGLNPFCSSRRQNPPGRNIPCSGGVFVPIIVAANLGPDLNNGQRLAIQNANRRFAPDDFFLDQNFRIQISNASASAPGQSVARSTIAARRSKPWRTGLTTSGNCKFSGARPFRIHDQKFRRRHAGLDAHFFVSTCRRQCGSIRRRSRCKSLRAFQAAAGPARPRP